MFRIADLRTRRALAGIGLASLALAGLVLVRATRAEPRALAEAGRACDEAAARAAGAIGSLLAFRDWEGALAAAREAAGRGTPVSAVVLDGAGRVAADHAAPLPGLSHVARAEVFFEGHRVGTLFLGFPLEGAREAAVRERTLLGAVAGALALLGAGILWTAVVGSFRTKIRRVSAEHARLALEKTSLSVRAAEAAAALERERRDRRLAESALSGRDLFEIERTEILEQIARGEELPAILSRLAALVEHRRPRTMCLVAPLRQGVIPVGSTGADESPFGGRSVPVAFGSTTPPLARAAAERRLVVTRDAAGDPLWEESRDTFTPHGFAACWTVPIEAGSGTVFGTLSLLLPDPEAPGVADIALLRNAARLASIAIEQRQLADQLAFQARHDRLTGLPSRLTMEEALHEAVSRAARLDDRVTLHFVDLDRFKRVNDVFGHAGGDALLAQAGFRIAAAAGEGDLVARTGGDEFCVLRVGPRDGSDPAVLSRQIVDAFRSPFDLFGQEVVVGASVGVSVFPDDAHDAMALQMHADAAMYAAKEDPVRSHHVFESGQTFRGGDRLRLENDLRRALARGELTLAFQVQTDLAGNLIGAEALVRWRHPALGELRPGRFIPIAEESGLIHPIGAWVFEEVCRRITQWQMAGLPVVPVAVNVSPIQFSAPELAATIEAALMAEGVSPSLVQLELTESLLIKDMAATMRVLGRLKALGIGLSVDDFGTGYSSLSYLQLLPIDELKIDQAFMRGLGRADADSRGPRVVQSMIALGHTLGLVVVAEGVETQEQLDALASLGCDRVQGFLVGRPAPADDFARRLAGQHVPHEAAAD